MLALRCGFLSNRLPSWAASLPGVICGPRGGPRDGLSRAFWGVPGHLLAQPGARPGASGGPSIPPPLRLSLPPPSQKPSLGRRLASASLPSAWFSQPQAEGRSCSFFPPPCQGLMVAIGSRPHVLASRCPAVSAPNTHRLQRCQIPGGQVSSAPTGPRGPSSCRRPKPQPAVWPLLSPVLAFWLGLPLPTRLPCLGRRSWKPGKMRG